LVRIELADEIVGGASVTAVNEVPMSREAEVARSVMVKRRNAITAIAAGGCLDYLAERLHGSFWGWGLLAGFFVGIFYANLYEYVLHRFFLHWGNGFLVQRHALHHNSTGAPQEPRYVNFATSPLVVLALFLGNAVPFLLLDHFLRIGIASGALIAFTIYYVLYEEIHWRFHLGGWLPASLRASRHHHLLHHGDFEGRYNVFLPLSDWIFQHRAWKRGAMMPHEH
jgi:Fatty acid hydroxylase superfamily